jgi:hypothetical protein
MVAAEHGGVGGEGRRHLSLVDRLLCGRNVMAVNRLALGGFASLLCGCLIKQQASNSVCLDDANAN